ncbi:hypothetical protein LJR090_000853 [Bosea sp. LjRoot90]|uniref:hypothetical protein n=1 Tax=Bosea sp. LjRoot90 TaxID=3342342 RepID=UPI003ED04C69
MSRKFAILGLATLVSAAMVEPAAAFWPRSQWLACSEAATAADYQRWRCWELDGYAGAIAPGFGGAGTEGQMPPQRRMRPRGTVSRLG